MLIQAFLRRVGPGDVRGRCARVRAAGQGDAAGPGSQIVAAMQRSPAGSSRLQEIATISPSDGLRIPEARSSPPAQTPCRHGRAIADGCSDCRIDGGVVDRVPRGAPGFPDDLGGGEEGPDPQALAASPQATAAFWSPIPAGGAIHSRHRRNSPTISAPNATPPRSSCRVPYRYRKVVNPRFIAASTLKGR